MNICSKLHHTAMAQGGGTTTFICPETGATMEVRVGHGGTFTPIKMLAGPGGKAPKLVSAKIAPFASAKKK